MNDLVCELIGRLAKASQVFMYRKHTRKNQLEINGVFGFSGGIIPATWHLSALENNHVAAVAYPSTSSVPELQEHPLRTLVPAAASLFGIRLKRENDAENAYIVVINPEPAFFADNERLTALLLLAEILAEVPASCCQSVEVSSDTASDGQAAKEFKPSPRAADDQATVSFLMKTLPVRHRILARDGVSFYATRAWRSNIKVYQQAALQCLKHAGADAFAKAVAKKLADTVVRQIGSNTIETVVTIPDDDDVQNYSLSNSLGKELAAYLNCRYADALRPKTIGRTKQRFSGFKLSEGQSVANLGTTLVVDDVIASGRHMELAVKTLRAKGVTCFGLGWLAS